MTTEQEPQLSALEREVMKAFGRVFPETMSVEGLQSRAVEFNLPIATVRELDQVLGSLEQKGQLQRDSDTHEFAITLEAERPDDLIEECTICGDPVWHWEDHRDAHLKCLRRQRELENANLYDDLARETANHAPAIPMQEGMTAAEQLNHFLSRSDEGWTALDRLILLRGVIALERFAAIWDEMAAFDDEATEEARAAEARE